MARLIDALTGQKARFAGLVALLGIVCLTGGGSRSDIQSLVILRPVSILLFFFGLMFFQQQDFRKVRMPMIFIIAFMLIAALQLVPLPYPIWSNLPGHSTIAEIDAMAGLGQIWRPLSLDPDRTWNTLFALFVPLAAITLVAIQRGKYINWIIPATIAIGLLSAIVGYLQAIGVGDLHFYAVTHIHHPVGLFANKNHQSILLLWLLLSAAWYITRIDPRSRSANLHFMGWLALMFVLFPLLLLTGSRAGLLLSVPVFGVGGWMLYRSRMVSGSIKRTGKNVRYALYGIGGLLTIALVAVFATLAFAGRQTALSRLFEADPAEEQRWIYFPILIDMARDFIFTGAGFGSFEKLFNQYEPGEVLSTRYLNQAHLDPLQIVIEGGLPGLLLLVFGLSWMAVTLWKAWRSRDRAKNNAALYFAGSFGLFMAASLVDYPLRTPMGATVFAILTAYLATLSVNSVPERDRMDK